MFVYYTNTMNQYPRIIFEPVYPVYRGDGRRLGGMLWGVADAVVPRRYNQNDRPSTPPPMNRGLRKTIRKTVAPRVLKKRSEVLLRREKQQLRSRRRRS
jgi:hypothetical protein